MLGLNLPSPLHSINACAPCRKVGAKIQGYVCYQHATENSNRA